MTNEQFQELVINHLKALTNEVKEIKSNQHKLELHIETEVTDKIRSLYEFREVQANVNERILAALDRIESKVETHDIQISILDKTKSNKRKVK
ncbi:hypothetical protein Dtox_3683 [Desulfofarcimen acetoxidans DSM 771]|uniref:Uncharacterized protein n=1 Tax=Desulfofarcimen acetoxidans (strain ATCC 49208 / DSM 771 / KCTC 5769 / VKM B-1644 / 5575) TaxID=485916 RepID=C8VWM8_DESAS|nr:hypothetical protein [Desulfofarcimen acetoxidans]ACV64392.1 hypothetical protein Dtox_3683 [Desulfofarcimen acetoxidans DSM 771]